MGLIETVKSIYSGDNSGIDYTHVSHSIIAAIIVGMWVWKSWELVGALCDFPPGVQLVLFAVVGAVPLSGAVNAYRAIGTQTTATSIVRTEQATVATTETKNADDDDSGTARP
jgi:hypothetical protein